MTCRGIGLGVVVLLGGLAGGGARAASVAPAFVGCPGQGMSGPEPVPARPRDLVALPGGLGFYAAAGLRVAAPPGWHCIELYGSGGAMLLVTPRRYSAETLPGFGVLVGPAVEVLFLNGENSGRDQVAEVFSRFFPRRQRFIRETAEGHEPVQHYPVGPFPTDSTVRRSGAVVDYVTPPHRQGMGTFSSRLRPDGAAIMGTAMLARSNGMDSVVLVNVRLPVRERALARDILAAARADRARQGPEMAR